MKTAPELLAIFAEAQEYIVLRACMGLSADPQANVLRNVIDAINELPPADKAAEQRVLDSVRGKQKRRTELRVIEGTRPADSIADAYEQTRRTAWVTGE